MIPIKPFAVLLGLGLATAVHADCPKAVIDTGSMQPVVRFLDMPQQPSGHYYALAVGDSQPRPLSKDAGGYSLPLKNGWLYWVAAPGDVADLDRYRIEADGADAGLSRGGTSLQEPLPVQIPADAVETMRPSLNLSKHVPKEALVCSMRLQLSLALNR